MGNAPAFADLEPKSVEDSQQHRGRVLLHVGEGVASSGDGTAIYSVLQPVGSDLHSALNGLSCVYSPIRRQNARISVRENDVWELKGRFSNAVRMAEPLPWVKDDQGKWSVTIHAETPSSVSGPSATASLQPSALPSNDSGSLQMQILALLNIPESLTTRGRSGDLRLAYAKYLAVLQAKTDMQKMMVDGTWTLGKVSADTLIELFVSKTVWYTYYAKLFPRVAKYSNLKQWLENDLNAQSSHDIWGVEKAVYTFQDLKGLLEFWDARSKRKEKRKLKESQDKLGDSGASSSKSKKQKRSKSCDDGEVSM